MTFLGWLSFYDIKGQCATCLNVVRECKMVACDYNRKEFGNAHNCPVYKCDIEE